MPKKTLTHSFVSNLKPKGKNFKRTEYYDEVVEGLILRITPTGYRSFSYRYGPTGKRYTIGKFPDISLAQARDFAKDLKHKVKQGADPQDEKLARRRKPKEKTIKDLAETFKKRYLPKLKASTQGDYKNRIDKVIVPALGHIEVNSLRRVDVIDLLEKIAEENKAPIQSNRIRAVLSSMYTFAVDRGIADDNPVSKTKKFGKENRRKRVYTEDEIRVVWQQFELQDEPYRSLFKMLLICGQRTGETRLMKWEHVKDGIWTIPAINTKANRTQILPLPDMALNVLEEIKILTGSSDFVLESPRLENKPIAWVQNRAKKVREDSKIKDFRLHDIRRTAASFMAELAIDRTVLGKVLNHKGLVGDNQVTAIYDRHEYIDEKKMALGAWCNRIEEILKPKKLSNIYQMR
jgi:integrase